MLLLPALRLLLCAPLGTLKFEIEIKELPNQLEKFHVSRQHRLEGSLSPILSTLQMPVAELNCESKWCNILHHSNFIQSICCHSRVAHKALSNQLYLLNVHKIASAIQQLMLFICRLLLNGCESDSIERVGNSNSDSECQQLFDRFLLFTQLSDTELTDWRHI